MKDRLLSTLGICRKAGKVVMGFDAVREAAGQGTVALILLSEDLSPNSAKEMIFTAGKTNVSVCTAPVTMDDIASRLGKRSGILGIADRGLATTVQSAVRTCSGTVNEEEQSL